MEADFLYHLEGVSARDRTDENVFQDNGNEGLGKRRNMQRERKIEHVEL